MSLMRPGPRPKRTFIASTGTSPAAAEMSFLQPLFDRLVAHEAGGAALPFVTLSYAQSVDGSIAVSPSQPFSLSSGKSYEMTHLLRSRHDGDMEAIKNFKS